MPFVRTARAQAPTFKAGVITSWSGREYFGRQFDQERIRALGRGANEKGGVEVGRERFMVEMFYGDDQSNPATGADAAERLIVQNEVDFLLGPYTSGSTIAVQPICQKYQVPMISVRPEAPNVWLAKPEFNFGIIPSVDTTSGQSLGVLVALSNPKAKTIAVIGSTNLFEGDRRRLPAPGAKEAGLEVVAYELCSGFRRSHPRNVQDRRPQP
ncbi:ABC transporter substrate-binding protein (plasmid) [Sinorhizobium meliloti]|nr:ABC transporter substrate-binding protein [Sinorhizobium meliloti]